MIQRKIFRNLISSILLIFFAGMTSVFFNCVFAAGVNLSVSGPASVTTGQSFSVSVNIDTQSSPVNAIQVTVDTDSNFTLDSNSIQLNNNVCSGVSSVISHSPLTILCGASNAGYTGAGSILTFSGTANNTGSTTVSLSNGEVAGGVGGSVHYTTNITSNATVQINSIATTTQTPTPTQQVVTTTQVTVKATPIAFTQPPKYVARPTIAIKQTPVTSTVIPTKAQPTLIVVTQPPIKLTPTSVNVQIPVATTSSNVQTLVQGYLNNTVTALLFVIPILALLLTVCFLSIRMFQMTRRRQREIELLFEHELGELAALESKMDIINEKGEKGKEIFKSEFIRTRDEILKEIKADYVGDTGKKA